MGIVAAGVHHAGILRGEGQAGLLDDGQGVHVGAEGDRGSFPPAADQGHNAVMGDPRLDLIDAHGPQVSGHLGRSPLLAVAQLGMGVEVAPPLDHRRHNLAGELGDAG